MAPTFKKGASANSSSSSTPGAVITSRPGRVNTKWSNDEIDSMVAQLKIAKDESNTSENGFKATVWQSISSSFGLELAKQSGLV
jgi:hypothetical protein